MFAALTEPDPDATMTKRVERFERDAARIRTWQTQHPHERRRAQGTIRKSNRTDHESAKMATSKGVRQGYTGVAAVDAAQQMIVDAQAHGTGSDPVRLIPIFAAEASMRARDALRTADAGSHSEAHLQERATRGVQALIADREMRET